MRSRDPVVQILVGLRIEQVRYLDQIANSRNLSRSEIVREAVDEWLLRHSEGGRQHGSQDD